MYGVRIDLEMKIGAPSERLLASMLSYEISLHTYIPITKIYIKFRFQFHQRSTENTCWT